MGSNKADKKSTCSNMNLLKGRCILCSGPDGETADTLGTFRTSCSEEENDSDIVVSLPDSAFWCRFILKQVLNLPNEECRDIKDIYGVEAAEGFKICGLCVRFVQKFRNRYEKITKLQKMLDCMRKQAEMELLQSLEEGGWSGHHREGEPSLSGWVHDYFENVVSAAQDWQLESWDKPNDSSGDGEPDDWHRCSSTKLGVVNVKSDGRGPESPEEHQDVEDIVQQISNMELSYGDSTSSSSITSSASEDSLLSNGSMSSDCPVGSHHQEQGGNLENQNENGTSCHANCPHCRPPGSAECVFCERTFVNQLSLDKHILLRHTGETQNPDNREEDPTPTEHVAPMLTRRRIGLTKNKRDTGELPEKPDQIPQNGVIPAVARRRGPPAKNKKTLRHTGETPTLTVTRSRKQSSGPVKKKTTRNYLCAICKKVFTNKGKLLRHTRGHTGEPSLECQLCGRIFRQKGALTRHFLTHTKEKPYRCSKCGTSFSYKDSLTSHNVRFHTHTTGPHHPFACVICKKILACPSSLKRHVKFVHLIRFP